MAEATQTARAEGTGSPTLAWVDVMTARKAAKDGVTEKEVAAYRKAMLERHGLVEADRKARRAARAAARKAAST